MSTFTLIVLVVASPMQTTTYMERGYATVKACEEAAKPYKAFEGMQAKRTRVTVEHKCIEVTK